VLAAYRVEAMAEQSHREEMSAAIRAQRERQARPRSIAGPPDPEPPDVEAPPPEPTAEAPRERPPRPKCFFSRFGR
jgi:hypothetical protein